MSRHVILGNGSLTIGLDQHGLVHDFYYPYVGLDNLTTARSSHHKIGVWVDGNFSWTDDGSWDCSVDFRDDALISHVSYTHHALGIHIQTEDFVHPYTDAFCRRLAATSLLPGERDVRVFMHQVFEISRDGRADTAMYVPDGNYIFDYKGKVCLIISGVNEVGDSFDQYAVGNYGIEGKEGTFKDAEDGELSGSPVEHGGVDSVMRFTKTLNEGESLYLDYWIAAAETQEAAERIHNTFMKDGMQLQRDRTLTYWQKWLETAKPSLANMSPLHKSAAQKSLLVIKSHIDKRGGIIASCDSSIYNYGRDYYSYVWPRDGAFAIWPLLRLGYQKEAKEFFAFCKNILTKEGYVMHKYQPDGSVGSTWHPLVHNHHKELAIQEDETAILIYMLYEYYRHTEDKAFVNEYYETLIKPATNFLASFIDKETGLPHASYDLWEEKFLTNTFTVSIVYGALLAAIELAKVSDNQADIGSWSKAAEQIRSGFGSLFNQDLSAYRKGILLHHDNSLGFDDTLDISSLFGMSMFAAEEETKEFTKQTLETIEDKLLNKSPSGGLPRYTHDQYFASDPPYYGNSWFVSTLWLAQVQMQHGKNQEASQLVDWTLKHALPSGVLSEQVDPTTGEAKSVTPLVWSHAELINTLLDLSST